MILIAVEGVDGVGKSSFVKALERKMFDTLSICPIVTKEPGSTLHAHGLQLRDLALNSPALEPLERELLFYIDALQHQKKLKKDYTNRVVITDRGLWTHLAYLRGHLKTKQMSYDDYGVCKELIFRCCQKPDVVIYLTAPEDVTEKRMLSRGGLMDQVEQNGIAYRRYVRETFDDLALAADFEGTRFIELDATRSLDDMASDALSYLQEVVSHDQLIKQSSLESDDQMGRHD